MYDSTNLLIVSHAQKVLQIRWLICIRWQVGGRKATDTPAIGDFNWKRPSKALNDEMHL